MGLFTGIRVVELASVLAGPAVGAFFAELGAEVIKVEPPAGDVTRTWQLAGETVTGGVSAYFSCVNWGKQRRVLNLKDPAQRTELYALLDTADVVIVNYKPGDAEKLGVAWETLHARNPKLIYAHLTGYGLNHPRAGYDAVVQAEAGFMHLNGEAEGGPCKMPVALMDLLAAHHLKQAILCALYAREKTGEGSKVSVSLIEAGLASLANQGTAWLVAGENPRRMGSEHPSIVPYGTVFTAADGKPLILAVGNDRQFADLCGLLKVAELAQDARFATNPARVRHRTELLPLLREAISRQTRAELLAALEAHEVPAGAVNDVAEALAAPAAQPMLLNDEASGLKGLRTVAFNGPDGWQETQLSPPPRTDAGNQ